MSNFTYPTLNGKTAAFTGHRPTKLGGYGMDARIRLRGLAAFYLSVTRPSRVISGMALGWDQVVAEAAIRLHIPVIAAVPFAGQESKWPVERQDFYRELLTHCAKVEIVSPGEYTIDKMQVRNEWMVDHGDHLTALWDGTSGGTCNCVRYAEREFRPITNLWDHYLQRGGPTMGYQPRSK
jgi:hypothetical protein